MELNLTSGSLEEQINFLKTIFDSIPFPIFIKNLNLEYVYTNRICAEKNGVKPEDLVGKRDADLWYESLPLVDEYNENDLKLIKTKKGFNKMIPIFTEKEIFYSLLTEEPLFDKNQNVVGIVGIFSLLPFVFYFSCYFELLRIQLQFSLMPDIYALLHITTLINRLNCHSKSCYSFHYYIKKILRIL